jgi:hypothetical protein
MNEPEASVTLQSELLLNTHMLLQYDPYQKAADEDEYERAERFAKT